jgi:ribosome-associated translation inhibitor RaiA/cold shock CspA family protein
MQIPVQVSFKDVKPSDFIKTAIEKHVARLERFFPRIIGCRVVVEAKNRHGHKGTLYSLGIDLSVPGKEIVIGRSGPKDHAHEDIHVAMRDAFNAAARALEDHARHIRGDVKPHDLPLQGKVVALFLEDGYGFIATPDGDEVMFRRESLGNRDLSTLKVGDEVHLTRPAEGGAIPTQAKSTSPGRRRSADRA